MGFVVLLAIGFVLFWAFLVGVTLQSLLYPPRRSTAWCVSRGEPEGPGSMESPREFERLTVKDPGNLPHELPYWRIDGDDPDGPALIFSHGWGESKQAVLQRVEALAPVCSEIIAWDMPGHGEAPQGRCRLGTSEPAALRDLVEIVQGEGLEHAKPVVLFGFSLGAGVSLQAAADLGDRTAGVIAEAPYRLPWTPAQSVMELRGFPHRLNLRPALAFVGFLADCGPAWKGFDRAELAGRLACPLLVLHGTDDGMCPIADGRDIARAAARGEICEIDGATHLAMWSSESAREQATEAVRSFIRSLTDAKTRAP